MQKYRLDPNDPEIMESLALGALIILDIVEQARATEAKSGSSESTSPSKERERDCVR